MITSILRYFLDDLRRLLSYQHFLILSTKNEKKYCFSLYLIGCILYNFQSKL
jgi:hypothetical protein